MKSNKCPTVLTLDEQISASYLLDRKLLKDFREAVNKFRKIYDEQKRKRSSRSV